MIPFVPPMLAGRGVPVDSLESYAAEPKLDGWRVSLRLREADALQVKPTNGNGNGKGGHA